MAETSQAAAADYRFGPFRIDPAMASLYRGESPVTLRRKSFDVLLYLVRNRGRVVPKDELMSRVWPEVVVTDNSLVQCIKEIREALDDTDQKIVSTAARRGYVFAAPLEDSVPSASVATSLQSRRAGMLVGAVVVALLALAGWWMSAAPPSPAAPATPLSVAIMPFSGPQGEDYFSSGIGTDIASALGRFPDLTVASPDVITHLRSSGASLDDIRRRFKVLYLVEGNVLRSPESIRIVVRLSDVSHGSLIWSDTFDAPAADVIDVNDRITSKIAGTLAVKLTTAQLRRASSKSPGSMEAYDHVLRGRERLSHLNRKSISEAREAFERAIALDRNYAPAYVGMGRVDLTAVALGWTPDAQEAFSRAENAALRAIALDEFDPRAHVLLGRTYARTGQYDRAVETLKRAVALNRSEPDSYAGLGDALLWNGDPAGAIDALESALAIDPRLSAEDLFGLGAAYFLAGRSADCARVLERATLRNEGNAFIYALLAAAYATGGREADARAAAAQARKLNPFFDAREFGSLFRKPEHRARLAAALQAASL